MTTTIRISLLLACSFVLNWPGRVQAVSNTGPGAIRKEVEQPVRQSINIRKDTQHSREKWLEERDRMLMELDRIENENRQLEAERKNLTAQVADTRQRIAQKQHELKGIRQISSDIEPFLQETFQWLEHECSTGLPFLEKERQERMKRLKALMDDPDCSISEKFRRLMEALLIEAEYGTSVEVSSENIDLAGDSVLVNVLRLGRLNLFYQTLDRSACGFYNMATRRWEQLPRRYERDIDMAVDMALKRRPVELVNLPVGRVVVK